MFKKENEKGAVGGDTVIALGVKVEGDFVSEGNVVIEGEVLGSLQTAQDLQVGDRAKITANVAASNALVAGEIRGNVTVNEKLVLTATSKVMGDIRAKVLIVEAGAELNGRVMMGGAAATFETPEAKESQAAGLSALVGGRRRRGEEIETPEQ
jgi:cytoskeletal protein CcmA (bactofilin family)